MTGRIAAVVLAAGRGRRWRGDGPKVLAPFAGRPLVTIAADAALCSGASPVIVVAGDVFPALHPCFSGRSIQLVYNPGHGSGITSSIRRGLEHVPADVRGCLILLADMPLVGATHVQHLMDGFAASGGAGICVPVYRGRRGNPVLWSSRYFPELMALRGDSGGRQLLTRYSKDVKEIEMDDDGILIDVDTRDELKDISRRCNLALPPGSMLG